jgi:hypothetical protein
VSFYEGVKIPCAYLEVEVIGKINDPRPGVREGGDVMAVPDLVPVEITLYKKKIEKEIDGGKDTRTDNRERLLPA